MLGVYFFPAYLIALLLVVLAESSINRTATTSHQKFSEQRRVLQSGAETTCDVLPDVNIENAWSWASRTQPKATGMIVLQNGVKRFERYAPENLCPMFCRFSWFRSIFVDMLGLFKHGGSPTHPLAMYSMTKTFSGLAALLLQKQGLIPSLDETVSRYIPQWKSEDEKMSVTIRELLSLSTGMQANIGITGHVFFRLAKAIGAPFSERRYFDYGAEPFLIFSKLVEEASGAPNAESFLKESLFSKLGISATFGYTSDSEKLTVLSSAGRMTLPDLATLGTELLNAANGNGIVFSPQDVADLTEPGLNPAYGLTVWLNNDGLDTESAAEVKTMYPACGTTEVFHGIGAGGQILTIVPERQLVIVKSAGLGRVTFADMSEFWDILFENQDCLCTSR